MVKGTTIRFSKMHGIGNDFVVVDCISQGIDETMEAMLEQAAQRICDRRFGVGSDGLILILPSRAADLRMRMFNPDGSEAEMCGNGTRCLAKYAYDHGLTDSQNITLETRAGLKTMKLLLRGKQVDQVRVDMGSPVLRKSLIPMAPPDAETFLDQPVKVAGKRLRLSAVSMGNPHAVLFDCGVDEGTVTTLGPLIEKHHLFPSKVNVQFAEVINTTEIVLRTWERGAGMTLACGTGACAAVVAGALTGRLNRKVEVHLKGGDLLIEWGGDNRVHMTGPAEEVFQGEFPLG